MGVTPKENQLIEDSVSTVSSAFISQLEKVDPKAASYKVRQTPTGGQQQQESSGANVPQSPSGGSSKNLAPGTPGTPSGGSGSGSTPNPPKSPTTPKAAPSGTQVMYNVTIVTGSIPDSGTSSNVFINIFGESTATGIIKLSEKAPKGKKFFQQGQTDVIQFTGPDVGEVKKIRLGHDNKGFSEAWYVDSVTLQNVVTGDSIYFEVKRWFDKKKDDGNIIRDLLPSSPSAVSAKVKYQVAVKTGDVTGAGTDANVFIIIYGESVDSGKIVFGDSKENKNKFERNQIDTFTVESVDVGDIKKIKIGHDDKGLGSDWHLDSVSISFDGKNWMFPCNKWLASGKDDKKIERELLPIATAPTTTTTTTTTTTSEKPQEQPKEQPKEAPKEAPKAEVKVPEKAQESAPTVDTAKTAPTGSEVKYIITVVTGNETGAGTDAKVSTTLFGENGDSGNLALVAGKDAFEKGKTDVFSFNLKDLGEIKKIKIGHDASGFGSDWFLDHVTVKNEATGTEWYFSCKAWINDKARSKELEPSLAPPKPADKKADTKAAEKPVEKPKEEKKEVAAPVVEKKEEKKETPVEAPKEVAAPAVEKPAEAVVETPKETAAAPSEVKYTINVVTGNETGAGTDAKVSITIFGEKGDSGSKLLPGTKDAFEKGKTDVFSFTLPDLGDLKKILIGHDAAGIGSDWLLDFVKIKNEFTGQEWWFVCRDWITTKVKVKELAATNVPPPTKATKEAAKKTTEPVKKEAGKEEKPVEKPATETKAATDKPAETPAVATPEKPVAETKADTKAAEKIPGGIQYTITTKTGDDRGAGTDSNVFIILFGTKGESGQKAIGTGKGSFERGKVDTFIIDSVDIGDLSKIRIGHDGKGASAGWFLEYVKVKNNVTTNEWTIPVNRWFAKDEDDKQIVRDLEPKQVEVTNKLIYKVTTYTGDVRGAGTDANVFVEIYGEKGQKSGAKKLDAKGNPFERAAADVFSVDSFDLGELSKIRIWHDNAGIGASWFLDRVTIENPTGKKWTFKCGRWLAKDEDDKQIERELPASIDDGKTAVTTFIPYQVTVVTGDRKGAGTNAKVFVVIYGANGDSGRRFLEDKAAKFERNITDKFTLSLLDLGELTRIHIGHDNSGLAPGWFLDKVIIFNPVTNKETYFLCGKWFDKSEGDGLIERDLPASDKDGVTYSPLVTYKIKVVTGDRKGAGTNANVFINIFGEKGDSGEKKLEAPNSFERARTDLFEIECGDLGVLKRIVIRHDNAGVAAGWFLEKVVVTSMLLQKDFFFLCGRWLDKAEDDGKIERELAASEKDGVASVPIIRYKVAVTTGTVRGAGTDANVSMTVYGANGNSGLVKLESATNPFESGATDNFGFDAEDLGKLTKIRIGHDNSGVGSSWFLAKVVITNTKTGEDTFFVCNRWLAKDEDDKQIERELPASDKDGTATAVMVPYKITIKTGDRPGAGTDANVFIQIFGEKGDTGKRVLKGKGNLFERNLTNEFSVESVDLGAITKIRIGHDGSGLGDSWFLEKVTISYADKQAFFLFGQWLGGSEALNGRKEVEIVASNADGVACKPMVQFKVIVVTGDRPGAATNAAVTLQIFGEEGDTGPRKLENPKKPFQRNQEDTFSFEAVDIGKVTKISIGHDGSDSWFLEKIIVRNELISKDWYFFAGRWLAKDMDDGKTTIELRPDDKDGRASLPLAKYKVTVTTGKLRGAGTDANVYIIVYGTNGDSNKHKLEAAGNNFESGKVDNFTIECLDLGQIQRIQLSHDNSGVGADWFVEKVEITKIGSEDVSTFLCNQWLSDSIGDKKTVRDFTVGGTAGPGVTVYTVGVITGSARNAGTDCDVTITIVGTLGKVEKKRLTNDPQNFERGRVDTFVVETTDLGDITSVTIGHDACGNFTNWMLDKVFIINNMTKKKWTFPANKWLDNTTKDSKLEVTLAPSQVDVTSYSVKVKTAAQNGAGTYARVFVTINGDKGATEKLELTSSITHRNKFQPGCLDVFTVAGTDVGVVSQVTVAHDNSGLEPEWLLEAVEITNMVTNASYYFECNKWFDLNKGDKVLSRVLLPVAAKKLVDEYKPELVKKIPEEVVQGFNGGKLTVKAIEGRELTAKGADNRSNPYLRMEVYDKGLLFPREKKSTTVVPNTLNPKWNQSVVFDTTSTTSYLKVQVFDKENASDAENADEFMGQVVVMPTDLMKPEPVWFPVKGRNNKDVVTGQIYLQFELADYVPIKDKDTY